jgi:hypothetical protein
MTEKDGIQGKEGRNGILALYLIEYNTIIYYMKVGY